MKIKVIVLLIVLLFNFSVVNADVISFYDLSPQTIDEKYGYDNGGSYGHGMISSYELAQRELNPQVSSWDMKLLTINLVVTFIFIFFILLVLRKIMNTKENSRKKVAFWIISLVILILFIVFSVCMILKATKINNQPTEVYFTLDYLNNSSYYTSYNSIDFDYDSYIYSSDDIQQYVENLFYKSNLLICGGKNPNGNYKYYEVNINVNGNKSTVLPSEVLTTLQNLTRQLKRDRLYGIHLEKSGKRLVSIEITENSSNEKIGTYYFTLDPIIDEINLDYYGYSRDDINKILDLMEKNESSLIGYKESNYYSVQDVILKYRYQQVKCKPKQVVNKLKEILKYGLYNNQSYGIHIDTKQDKVTLIEIKESASYSFDYERLKQDIEYGTLYSVEEIKSIIEKLKAHKQDYLIANENGIFIPDVEIYERGLKNGQEHAENVIDEICYELEEDIQYIEWHYQSFGNEEVYNRKQFGIDVVKKDGKIIGLDILDGQG